MAKAKMTDEKEIELKSLLSAYKTEVYALEGVKAVWRQLPNKSRDICAKDFDEAIVARETALEQINKYKSLELKTILNEIDEMLSGRAKMASELYGFKVASYLKNNE